MSSLGAEAIRDLGLAIGGTPLASIVAAFEREIRAAGLGRLHPRFYLSTEWGVPFPSVAIAIPFYLARPDLTALHLEKTGLVEGLDAADILRYLRHELGHVVNYAYRLHEEPAWTHLFGAFTHPYSEDYAPRPFSRHHVRHLPGWYAQKHPDEDWSETFAVWMTPGSTWREDYANWPDALAKLEYCDRTMGRIGDMEPLVTDADLHEDVSELAGTVDDFYARPGDDGDHEELPAGIDGALRSIFAGGDRPAGSLFARLEQDLVAGVYRWTGHHPERTLVLLRRLARRSEALAYAMEREQSVAVELTALVTTLAMTHLHGRRP